MGVLRVYDTLDSYGNRITKIETTSLATAKDIARLEKADEILTKQVENLNGFWYTEIYPRFYGEGK